MFDKILQINLLLDFYGQLLTDKQQNILQLYYIDDLSLMEIAEQLGISRQAVYDTMKRTEKILYDYEEKLGLLTKFVYSQDRIQEIVKISCNIEFGLTNNIFSNDEILSEINKIIKISKDILEK